MSIPASEGSAIPQHVAIWAICAASIVGVLTRPRGIAEWVWALGGAVLLAITGLVPLSQVGQAVAKGTDVYLFLGGMMLLAEIARREGVFDWVASHAVRAAKGSRLRLFGLVYGVGVLVTIVLSNDATAVVLTPAVAAAIRKAKAEPLPYVLACAFVANAASFVLPISNPANLVVFAGAVPSLPRWLASFALPSFLAIVTTVAILALVSRGGLRGAMASDVEASPLGRSGALVLAGIAVTAVALVTASTFDAPLGATTLACGLFVFAVAAIRDRAAFAPVLRNVSWPVLFLVAGLFVLVQGLDVTGALEVTRRLAGAMVALPSTLANLGAAAMTAAASNLINNLPAGLIAGGAVASLRDHAAFRSAVAIGIDLGPNLSVTGSLATVLWLMALRREKIEVTAWTFLRAGALVMPPALVLAVACLTLVAH
jgi:arsenical pump membrane protein